MGLYPVLYHYRSVLGVDVNADPPKRNGKIPQGDRDHAMTGKLTVEFPIVTRVLVVADAPDNGTTASTLAAGVYAAVTLKIPYE